MDSVVRIWIFFLGGGPKSWDGDDHDSPYLHLGFTGAWHRIFVLRSEFCLFFRIRFDSRKRDLTSILLNLTLLVICTFKL